MKRKLEDQLSIVEGDEAETQAFRTALRRVEDDEAADRREIELVATGLRWHQGVPLACDATLVSPLHADGTPWAGADEVDGVAEWLDLTACCPDH